MKRLVYQREDGGVTVIVPVEGGRYASSVEVGGESLSAPEPQPVDQFFRGWPVDGAVAQWAETEDEWLQRLAERLIPQGVPFSLVDASTLPASRTFRNAWSLEKGAVAVDMVRARDIVRSNIRLERAPLLASADVDYLRADEAGDAQAKAGAAALKQRLRDATKDPRIAAAQTPDELALLTPAVILAG